MWDLANIATMITAVTALAAVFVQWYRSRGEGIQAVAEGYDRLLPHLNKRIKELEEADKAKTKEIEQLTRRMEKSEAKDTERQAAIEAAISQLRDTIALLETVK